MLNQAIILDNIIFGLQKNGGISVYWLELIKRLAASGEDVTFLGQVPSPSSYPMFQESQRVHCRPFPGMLPLKLARYFPIRATFPTPTIFHSSYYRVLPQKNIVNIVTLFDFIYERFRKGPAKIINAWQKKYALGKADGIICISESTKKDLLYYLPEFSHKSIKVIPLGVSLDFTVLPEYDPSFNKFDDIISEKYILFIGARNGYKNFNLAVDSVSDLPDCHLLLIGGGGLSGTERTNLNKKLKGRYRHVQGVNNHLLNYFYNHAFCLLYPSSFEGFGMPLLEAMRAGCPVVAANVSSIPEVCGKAGLLACEATVPNFIEKIILLNDPVCREKAIADGRVQAHKFSWDTCYTQTLQFYTQVFEEKMTRNWEQKTSSD